MTRGRKQKSLSRLFLLAGNYPQGKREKPREDLVLKREARRMEWKESMHLLEINVGKTLPFPSPFFSNCSDAQKAPFHPPAIKSTWLSPIPSPNSLRHKISGFECSKSEYIGMNKGGSRKCGKNGSAHSLTIELSSMVSKLMTVTWKSTSVALPEKIRMNNFEL